MVAASSHEIVTLSMLAASRSLCLEIDPGLSHQVRDECFLSCKVEQAAFTEFTCTPGLRRPVEDSTAEQDFACCVCICF